MGIVVCKRLKTDRYNQNVEITVEPSNGKGSRALLGQMLRGCFPMFSAKPLLVFVTQV